jgi:hypothetical protein
MTEKDTMNETLLFELTIQREACELHASNLPVLITQFPSLWLESLHYKGEI